MVRRGVFPGSFDPLTVAHLAVADAAHEQCRLDVIDLVISEVPLAKEHRRQLPVAERLRAIEARTVDRPWLRARNSHRQLLADIAAGYDVLVLGADKWHQLHDPTFYGGSLDAVRDALGRLPTVAVAPRAGSELPDADEVVVLEIDDDHREISSTAVRRGRHEWRA